MVMRRTTVTVVSELSAGTGLSKSGRGVGTGSVHPWPAALSLKATVRKSVAWEVLLRYRSPTGCALPAF